MEEFIAWEGAGTRIVGWPLKTCEVAHCLHHGREQPFTVWKGEEVIGFTFTLQEAKRMVARNVR